MSPSRPKALITGASSGIGAVFARILAGRGYDLILVARRRERLEELAREFKEQHGAETEVLTADLGKAEDVGRLTNYIEGCQDLRLLINNAGFGTTGFFADIDVEKQAEMIHVHVLASIRLIRAALPNMIAAHQGSIINVASMSAFIPMPNSVTYAATKAFLITFSQGLAKELTGTGVQAQALCPGFTYTEFHDTPEFKSFERSQTSRMLWMTSEAVVEESLNALERGNVTVVPGRVNRFFLAIGRGPIGKIIVALFAKKRWAKPKG